MCFTVFCQRLQQHCCGGPPSDERRPPAAAHNKFQSSNVLKHVKHRETAKRPCIRMKRLREAVQRNFTRVPQQEGEAACTSQHSLQTQCSQCEKQTATAGCEVYTSCTVTKQASLSLHCSQARLCIFCVLRVQSSAGSAVSCVPVFF